MMMDKTIRQAVNKLLIEGITKDNYTKENAKKVFEKCCGVAILLYILENKEEQIIELLFSK